MHPILFKVGPIEIQAWWVLFLSGFFLAGFLARRQATHAPTKREMTMLFGWMLIGAIVGGRLASVAWHFSEYAAEPLKILDIFGGGQISFGGTALAAVFGIFYARRAGLPILKTGDMVVLYVPIIDAMRRLGCFLGGCCWGKYTDLPIGIRPPNGYVHYHPTQLYFIGWFAVMFYILRKLYYKPHRKGAIFVSYFLLYFPGRFIIEFFRREYALRQGLLTVPQVICLSAFFIFLVLFVQTQKRRVLK